MIEYPVKGYSVSKFGDVLLVRSGEANSLYTDMLPACSGLNPLTELIPLGLTWPGLARVGGRGEGERRDRGSDRNRDRGDMETQGKRRWR